MTRRPNSNMEDLIEGLHSARGACNAPTDGGGLGATARDAEDDDGTEEDAAPSDVAEAPDAWIARNLAALQERAEQGCSAFEQRLAEAGQGLPRSARGRIGVRVRPQRGDRATLGAFSIEWVTYRHVRTASGVVYLSD